MFKVKKWTEKISPRNDKLLSSMTPDCIVQRGHRKCSSPLLLQLPKNNVEGGIATKMAAKNMYTMEKKRENDKMIQEHKSKLTRLTTKSSSLLLISCFTKGCYYYQQQQLQATQISSQLIHLLESSHLSLSSVVKRKLSGVSRILGSLVTLLLVLVISQSLPSPADAVGLYEQSKCETYGWNALPVWKVRAPPRWVAPMNMDRKMQKEFLQLFRGGDTYGDGGSSSSEEESYEDEQVPVNIEELHRIGDMCPKDAFFYSLSPKHADAIVAVARMFVEQHSPAEVLKLAKVLLRSRHVNPKVWYYAIIVASQERPDMTGFKLAHPIDAMPDLFIPGPMLFEVMDKYKSALQDRSGLPMNGTFLTAALKRLKRSTSSSSGRLTKRKQIRKSTAASRKNDTIADTFSNTEIGRSKNDKSRVLPMLDNHNSIKSHYRQRQQQYSRPQQQQQSSLNKNKRKKKNYKKKAAQDTTGLVGNITEYRADSSMWKRGRIDAFDDCIVVDGSIGIRNGIENKLWYFREDLMVNQHHWYWHQEYPLNTTMHRPRRAELFFYMHRNLIARYNAERLSNGMPLVQKFDIRPGAEIKSAYDSQLADVNSGKFWTPRPHGVRLTDILHMDNPDFERNILIGQYNDLYWRLARSVKIGHLLTGPVSTVKIKNTKGIEPLGNTVEASTLSANPMFYDAMGFHNLGHQLIGFSTDPHFKDRLPPGVMGDTMVTMRDPVFYTYHTVVDNLFDLYKKALKPYQLKGGEYPLRWDGVEILDIEVVSKNGGHSPNQLRTFWSTRRFELSPGVDQSIHKGDLEVDVCAVHLNHEPFDFKITVTLDPCAKTKTNKGSVRIFLAPRYDEHGNRFPLSVQRRMMIHMDTFPVDLRVGRNVIYRRSFDSNVVTPWSKTLKQYEHPPKHPLAADYCGCGWPTHLYIPKGSKEGLQFDLFVMLTNYDHDMVEEDPRTAHIPEPCNSPYMYCGVKWRNYPDAKPMGYPFDRLPFSVPIKCPMIGAGPLWSKLLCRFLQLFLFKPVGYLEEYVSYAPNMASTVVEITHLDKLVW